MKYTFLFTAERQSTRVEHYICISSGHSGTRCFCLIFFLYYMEGFSLTGWEGSFFLQKRLQDCNVKTKRSNKMDFFLRRNLEWLKEWTEHVILATSLQQGYFLYASFYYFYTLHLHLKCLVYILY